LELAKAPIVGIDSPVLGTTNRLWCMKLLHWNWFKALRGASESFSWKLQAFFILSESKAIIITKALSKKYSTKILPFFASFMRYPNWVDVPNLIILSFFLSLEIPKKKY
jgi:hypothetical protein